MIHAFMLGDVGQWLHLTIGCSFIRVDSCSWQHVPLNNGQQCCSCPVWNQLHIPQCWCNRGVHHAEHPQFTCCGSSSVILRRIVRHCHVNCDGYTEVMSLIIEYYTFGLCLKRLSSICTTFSQPSSLTVQALLHTPHKTIDMHLWPWILTLLLLP